MEIKKNTTGGMVICFNALKFVVVPAGRLFSSLVKEDNFSEGKRDFEHLSLLFLDGLLKILVPITI